MNRPRADARMWSEQASNLAWLLRRERWTWPIFLLSIGACIVAAWLHAQQQQNFSRIVTSVGELHQARIDLIGGFLAITLSDTEASPFDRNQGVALLQQAITAFASTANILDPLLVDQPLVADFETNVRRFQQELLAWRARPTPSPTDELTLRIAFSQLERQASELDQQTHQQLMLLSNHMSHTFLATLVGATLMLTLLCGVVIQVGRLERRAVAALRQHEEQLHVLTETMPAVAWSATANGERTYVNTQWEKLTGFPIDKLPPNEWLTLLHPEDQAAIGEAWQTAVRTHENWQATFRLRTADGSYRWQRSQGRPQYDDKGAVIGWHGFTDDIHEQYLIAEALREERDRFQTLVDTVPGVVHAYQQFPDNSIRFPYASPRIAEIYGFTPEQLAKDAGVIQQRCHPDDVARIFASVATSLAHMTTWHEEFRVRHPTKGELWVEGRSIPKAQPDGSVLWYGVLSDITDRKRAEHAARASEERLQAVVTHLAEGLVMADENEEMIYWNHAALQMHGFTKLEEVLKPRKAFQSLFTISTLDGVPLPFDQWPMARLQREEPVRNLELQISRLGTDWVRIFSYGGTVVQNVAGRHLFVMTVVDVTERVQAELALQEALRQKEETLAQLDALFSAAPIGLGFWDRDLRFMRLNQTLADANGVPIDEHIGRHVREVVPDLQDVEQMISAWQQVIATGEPLLGVEVSGATAAWPGQTRYWLDNFFPVRVGGEIVGIGATVMDITARKRAEQEVSALNSELEQRVLERTTQLQAVNQELEAFAYSVSHDLRAPLRAVDGYARILLEDYAKKLDPEAVRVGEIVCNEAQRMGQLIDDLLAFSRLSRVQLQMRPIEMTPLVQTLFAQLHTESIQEVTFICPPLPPAKGDPATIRQVWQNLLTNALKFTQKRPVAHIEIGADDTSHETIYWIRDNGAGFDMRYVDKLFGVFQRLHSARDFPGTGVGLAIVQRIVHRHGGRVWAEGAVDVGATFYFALPKEG
jgi:PAS domain S-box-containing protein